MKIFLSICKIFLCFLTCASFIQLKAQDIHFTQFYAPSLVLNPGLSGTFEGDWRFFGIYRNQWSSIGVPYSTPSLAYDQHFYLANNHFSGGAVLVNDQSGETKLQVTKIFLTGAYHFHIKGHALHVGIQPGYVRKEFKTDKLTFPEQWDKTKGKFNTEAPKTEAGLGENASYFDLNTGIVWNKTFGKLTPEAGFALFHITQPKESFFNKDNNLPIRKVFHASVSADVLEKFVLMPKVLYMWQSKANDLLFGSNVGYRLPENPFHIRLPFAGVFFRDGLARNFDAFAIVLGASYKRWDFGVSYDVNVSALKLATRNRGAWEISAIYTAPSTKLTHLTTPCDRY